MVYLMLINLEISTYSPVMAKYKSKLTQTLKYTNIHYKPSKFKNTQVDKN